MSDDYAYQESPPTLEVNLRLVRTFPFPLANHLLRLLEHRIDYRLGDGSPVNLVLRVF